MLGVFPTDCMLEFSQQKKTYPSWLVVSNMFIFHFIYAIIIPTDFHSIIFQRGLGPNHQPASNVTRIQFLSVHEIHSTLLFLVMTWAMQCAQSWAPLLRNLQSLMVKLCQVYDGVTIALLDCVIPHTDRPYCIFFQNCIFQGYPSLYRQCESCCNGSIPRETPSKVHQRTVPGCCADHRQPLPKHLQGSWLWCWGGPVAIDGYSHPWNPLKSHEIGTNSQSMIILIANYIMVILNYIYDFVEKIVD